MSWDNLIEVFNPGHKHFADERDRKQIEAQIPGSEGNDPNASYVDLDRGIVHLAVPPQRFGQEPEPEPAEPDPEADDTEQ